LAIVLIAFLYTHYDRGQSYRECVEETLYENSRDLPRNPDDLANFIAEYCHHWLEPEPDRQ
jgi:hypothetical protein